MSDKNNSFLLSIPSNKSFTTGELFVLIPGFENITSYIQPILKSTTGYDLLEDRKYPINMIDTESGEAARAEVVNLHDVLSIIMTVQIESTLIFIENLLKDDKVVMIDELQNSFEKYAVDIRRVIDDPETFMKNENT